MSHSPCSSWISLAAPASCVSAAVGLVVLPTLRGNSTNLNIAIAMGSPAFIPWSLAGALDFCLSTFGLGLGLADLREEQLGTGADTRRRVSWHPDRAWGNGYHVQIRMGNHNDLQNLTSCRASWMLEPWGDDQDTESRQFTLDARLRKLIETGSTLLTTVLLGALLCIVQCVILFSVTSSKELRTLFTGILALNWSLIACQWASSFSYSNAYRGVQAPWVTIPDIHELLPPTAAQLEAELHLLPRWKRCLLRLAAASISLRYDGTFDAIRGLRLFRLAHGSRSVMVTQIIDNNRDRHVNVPEDIANLVSVQFTGRPTYAVSLFFPSFLFVGAAGILGIIGSGNVSHGMTVVDGGDGTSFGLENREEEDQ
ncbi:MAG: hypothetical protein CYPHOPRED_003725 [Cyphobasidiales sp. Tagirdzhanova-0007]|nr:MAG: hypothetical protein CYPHOPRED_003725 [Cyphobasidiales sp. Tagirdzhanova-0007]